MTYNEIISEFILQLIKQGDLVEIELSKQHKLIKGFIINEDVFPPLNVKLVVENVMFNANHKQNYIIELRNYNDGKENTVSLIPGVLHLAGIPYREIIRIHIEDITGITKLTK